MERTERSEKNDTQKAKLFFLILAVAVAGLLVWSVVSANKARSERDAVKMEVETLKQDNAKLEQMVKDLNQENNVLRNQVKQFQAKSKAKPVAKKKIKPAKKTAKKKPKITNVN